MGRVGGQHHSPSALRPVKNRYPLYWRLGGPRGRSGRMRKISPPTGIRSTDRLARSESLYRLSYPGSVFPVLRLFEHCSCLSDSLENILADTTFAVEKRNNLCRIQSPNFIMRLFRVTLEYHILSGKTSWNLSLHVRLLVLQYLRLLVSV